MRWRNSSGLKYVDLGAFKMNEELLNTLPTDAIYRFHFVPLEMTSGVLSIAVSDPTDVVRLDELELLLACPLSISIATESAISSVIKAGEGTRRVLREVSEDFMLQLVKETDRGEEVLSVENISRRYQSDHQADQHHHSGRAQPSRK